MPSNENYYFDATVLGALLPLATAQECHEILTYFLIQLQELHTALLAMEFPRDIQLFSEWAHKCKSSSFNIGANNLGEYLSNAEILLSEEAELSTYLENRNETLRLIAATKKEIEEFMAN